MSLANYVVLAVGLKLKWILRKRPLYFQNDLLLTYRDFKNSTEIYVRKIRFSWI